MNEFYLSDSTHNHILKLREKINIINKWENIFYSKALFFMDNKICMYARNIGTYYYIHMGATFIKSDHIAYAL